MPVSFETRAKSCGIAHWLRADTKVLLIGFFIGRRNSISSPVGQV